MICPQCQSQNADNARFCEACGTRLEGPAAPLPVAPAPAADPATVTLTSGAVIGDRFRITTEIGRGDMGPVYRAVDTLSDKEVVVRLMRPDRLLGANAVKNALRDALLARDIRHPNVVAIYDAGEIVGMVYVVEELVDGPSLSLWNVLKRLEGVPLAQAAGVMRQLAAGLEAGHARGVIHRNLKPGNVRVIDNSEEGGKAPGVVIEDFGLWRASSVTQTGATGSKPMPYMAPELITSPDIAQPSSDVYSMSVMLYELLTHELPSGEWSPPSAQRPDTPASVDELIKKGLSNNPKLRPQSAKAFLAELDAAVAQAVKAPQAPLPPEPAPVIAAKPEPIPAPPPPAPPPSPPSPQSPPGPAKPFFGLPMPAVYAGGGVLVTAIGAFAVMSLMGGPKPATPAPGTPTIGGLPDPYASTTPPQMAPLPGTSTPLLLPPPPPPPPLPPPPPPQQPQGYQDLSGYWLDDAGNRINVSVNAYGAVTGQVVQGAFSGMGFAGQFAGGGFSFQVGNALGIVAASTGQMTDACHIKFQTFDAFTGQPNGYSQIHINHLPGQDCP